MAAKTILALLAGLFLLLAGGRIVRDGGSIGPAARSWLTVGLIFAAVAGWLWFGV